MAEKTLILDGKEIKFKNTFRTARIYRDIFKSDMVGDMQKLAKTTEKKADAEIDFEIIERCCYAMAKHGMGEEIGDIDSFLDTIDYGDMNNLISMLTELWNMNSATTVVRKKK